MIKEIFNGIFKLIKFILVFTFKYIKLFFSNLYKIYNEVIIDYRKHKKMSDFVKTDKKEIL